MLPLQNWLGIIPRERLLSSFVILLDGDLTATHMNGNLFFVFFSLYIYHFSSTGTWRPELVLVFFVAVL